jgi:magnesium chelatase family protein
VSGRVLAARRMATGRQVRANAELPGATLQRDVPMTKEASRLLESRMRSGSLSARGVHRVHRIARTIADLEEALRTKPTVDAGGFILSGDY